LGSLNLFEKMGIDIWTFSWDVQLCRNLRCIGAPAQTEHPYMFPHQQWVYILH